MVDKRKRDARARAAETGESYTRAARAVAQPMDRDTRWLIDLLAMLPAMTGARAAERRSWWEKYAHVHSQGWSAEYYVDSLVPFAGRVVRHEADDEDIRRLAEHCLMFFDVADRPECCEELSTVLGIVSPSSMGRRWAESVCEVAWRLYVPRESPMLVREGRGAWPAAGG